MIHDLIHKCHVRGIFFINVKCAINVLHSFRTNWSLKGSTRPLIKKGKKNRQQIEHPNPFLASQITNIKKFVKIVVLLNNPVTMFQFVQGLSQQQKNGEF